ncbi:MAG: hypothetical protein ABIV93_24975 [Byssovorax sp.]
MTATGSARLTYDTSVTLNGLGSLRLSSDDCNMFVATGGPTSTFHLLVLAKCISAGSTGNNASTFASLGTPGGSGASGIGSTPPSGGPLLWGGGYGNPVIQQVAAPFDDEVRVIELMNYGNRLLLRREFGDLAEVEGTTVLGDASMGLRWSFPLASFYGAPPTRVFSFLAADRPLTGPETVSLSTFIKRKFALAPRRMVVAIGDSTVAGNINNAELVTTTSWVKEMSVQYATAGTPIDYINAGISGQSSAQILTRVTPAFLDRIQQAGSTYRRTDLILCAWYNDPAAGIPYQQTYANLVAASDLARARGIRTWIGTTFGGVGLAAQTLANAFSLNDLIVNGAGTYGAIDWRGLAPWSPTVAQLPDQVHQSTALLQDQAATAIQVIG